MTKHLHNLLTATGILMLCLFAAIPARALTAQQMISIGKNGGFELVYEGYGKATMHSYGNGIGVRIEESEYGTDWVKITNMFNGLVDLHFKVFDDEYGGEIVLGNNAGLSSSYGIYGQIMPSNNPNYAKVCVTPTNQMNSGDVTNTQISGTITYDSNKNAFQIDFSAPRMKVRCFKSSSATALSKSDYTEYHNLYSLVFYQPNASVTDTKVTGTGSTSVNRSYKTEFRWNSDDTFVVTNWGGTGLGISGSQTSTPPYISNTWYRMTGYYDPINMKMYMDGNTMYLQDNSEVGINSAGTSYIGSPYTYRMVAVNSADNPTQSYTRDIVGDVDFDEQTVQHTGTDLWATPHGGLKTTGSMIVSFEDWGVYNTARNDLGKTFGFRVKNMKVNIDEFDVTLALKHEALSLIPGTTDNNLLPVNVSASFSVARNHIYADNFDVYLVEGTDPKGTNAIYLGNVAKNSENLYKVNGTFKLPSPDGKNWSTHLNEQHSYPYTLMAVAHYNVPSSTPVAPGIKMAAGLDPSNHGLGTAYLNFTVGVDGVNAESNLTLENTQNGVIVHAPNDMAVEVYNMAGVKVAQGVANSEITFDGKGVFVVKAGAKVFKVVK